MDAKSQDHDYALRIYTSCKYDIPYIIIDTRPQKEFKAGHLPGAFCVRLSTNGHVLADYSQSSYNIKWSQDCWWGRHVFVYGESGLKKDHPVIKFLSRQGKCKSLSYFKDGFSALEKAYPLLSTTSVKAAHIPRLPSQIIPRALYLGDWDHATDTDRLSDLKIRRILTIHNHPENLKPPASIVRHHLRCPLPDIEDADISQHFQRAYEFMEEGRAKGEAVLVHCGAGVSRSATLTMMYLMRHHVWTAARARQFVEDRRSVVCINDGFWATLCALEERLGIPPGQRSDPLKTTGFRGADAGPPGSAEDAPPAAAVQLSRDAAGEKVAVRQLSVKEAEAEAKGAGAKRAAGEADEPAAKRQAGASAAPTLVLEVRKPDGPVGQLRIGPLGPTQRCVLGRSPDCDVVLEHASISRQHAALTADRSGAVYVSDLQSGHGTKLGDVWLKPNAPRQLQPGALLSFGASTRTYKVLAVER